MQTDTNKLQSRKAYALVNKAWHVEFQPSVWKHFSINGPMKRVKTDVDKQVMPNSLRKKLVSYV